MDLGLAGRTALVAAASRGLGRATALALAAEGCNVAACARHAEDLSGLAAEIESSGVRALPIVADLTREADIHAAVAQTVAATGRLDVLVVNSGGPAPGWFRDADDAAWRSAIDLLLMSAIHLVRTSLPALSESDAASILFLASSSVKVPIPGLLLSNSVRAAVQGLAKTLAIELAPGVRVNTILTGRIRTQRTEALARHSNPGEDLDAVLERQGRALPLQRFGTVEEFARVATFLSSPAASYVTGAALAVDGGLIPTLF
ncbi:MAG: SDR family oxidoreductase [Candidatus Dormibacteria bacterium]